MTGKGGIVQTFPDVGARERHAKGIIGSAHRAPARLPDDQYGSTSTAVPLS